MKGLGRAALRLVRLLLFTGSDMNRPGLPRLIQRLLLLLLLSRLNGPLKGAVINVTTNDTYAKIEGAKAGDEVVVAPGSYAFRVYLTQQATPAQPIKIHGLDPARPPVWDFGTTLVENAPGSYTAGDRGRGGWQFSGARNYQVSGLVFRHCRTASFGFPSRHGSVLRYGLACCVWPVATGRTAGPGVATTATLLRWLLNGRGGQATK